MVEIGKQYYCFHFCGNQSINRRLCRKQQFVTNLGISTILLFCNLFPPKTPLLSVRLVSVRACVRVCLSTRTGPPCA
jgi:hypothetical protein